MLPVQHWARNFTVKDDDIEYLVNLLLEKETPLSSYQLAHVLLEGRLEQEATALEEKYQDSKVYSPAESYEVGQKVVFPAMEYATATVSAVRAGNNTEHGAFDVIAVDFEDDGSAREFAAALTTPHKLTEETHTGSALVLESLSADEIMEVMGDEIVAILANHLEEKTDLIHLAGKWFPLDLLLAVDDGQLHLAEAVLDINGGGPLKTRDILNEIGGLGESHISLQEFSMNYALNEDKRFDEVGPAGEVLWYLRHMEPADVQKMPALLRVHPAPHNRDAMTPEMLKLEVELGDELSPLDAATGISKGTITLNYPHRRAGTLPLSPKIRALFPTARSTDHIYITLVDSEDNEEYTGWVVQEGHYVYGLKALYEKYALPIGAHITVTPGASPGKIILNLHTHKPRSEWIPLLVPKGEQIGFETSKRAIGAEYDDLMILGIDELAELDTLLKTYNRQNHTLAATMRMLLPGLCRLNPQGTAHIQTLYSAVNVVRRCPPAAIMATLASNPDFENVGGHYWKLADL